MARERLRRAAFVDRDGVLNEERGYVHRKEDFAFLSGSIAALAQLQSAGYAIVVVTNQSGIARGMYSESDFARLSEHMRTELLHAGVSLDAIKYCPHLPDAAVKEYRLDCPCRKPRPGMLLQAIDELGLDATSSIIVGDRLADVQAGRGARVGRCLLVRSGHALSEAEEKVADAVYENLADCVVAELDHA